VCEGGAEAREGGGMLKKTTIHTISLFSLIYRGGQFSCRGGPLMR
jgi:hypothetical protein